MEKDSNDLKFIPVLPSKNTVIFPKMIFPMYIGRELSLLSLERAVSSGGNVLVVAQKSHDIESPKGKDMHRVGVVAKVLQVLKLQSSSVKVLMEGIERVKITKFDIDGNSISAAYEQMPDKMSNSRDYDALKMTLLERFQSYVESNGKINRDVLDSIGEINDPGTLCNAIASHMHIKLAKKQTLLATLSVYKRMKSLIGSIQSEIDLLSAQNKIKDEVKSQIEKNQKEYYLNEQLKAIHKELGDEDVKKEWDQLEKSMKEAGLSSEAKQKAESELKRLKTLNPASAESNMGRTYLEWLVNLPWKKSSKLKKDFKKATEVLEEGHYGLKKIKDRILEHIAVGIRLDKPSGGVLCLYGPPGVGKTSLAKSIAEATGRKFAKISLGGIRDEAEIRGHRRTYIGAMPGKIIQAMKKVETSNPLILLDEIDKVSQDYRGDPSSALLEVLDPEQNNSFGDHYLGVDYDLSEVMFVCTANSTDMSRPLLDRMELVNVSGYSEEEKLEIAKRHLLSKQRKLHGLKEEEVEIDDSAISEIIRHYTRESGVRGLNMSIAKVMRKSLQKILNGESETYKITKEDIFSLLGPRKILHNAVLMQPSVGICNGLAYTQTGGDILHIEVAIVPGKGEIKTTGKLGDVMKESVFAAITYIRSQYKELKIDREVFTKNDIHLHVPEGAVPKDGPSAGTAIFTAILSAVSGRPVRNDIAMTGEITLRGQVLAIGGLKEKLLAAAASGVKQVFIPVDNERDLLDISQSSIKALVITPVNKVSELLSEVFADKDEIKPDSESVIHCENIPLMETHIS